MINTDAIKLRRPITVNTVSSWNDRIHESKIKGNKATIVTVTLDIPKIWPHSSPGETDGEIGRDKEWVRERETKEREVEIDSKKEYEI